MEQGSCIKMLRAARDSKMEGRRAGRQAREKTGGGKVEGGKEECMWNST